MALSMVWIVAAVALVFFIFIYTRFIKQHFEFDVEKAEKKGGWFSRKESPPMKDKKGFLARLRERFSQRKKQHMQTLDELGHEEKRGLTAAQRSLQHARDAEQLLRDQSPDKDRFVRTFQGLGQQLVSFLDAAEQEIATLERTQRENEDALRTAPSPKIQKDLRIQQQQIKSLLDPLKQAKKVAQRALEKIQQTLQTIDTIAHDVLERVLTEVKSSTTTLLQTELTGTEKIKALQSSVTAEEADEAHVADVVEKLPEQRDQRELTTAITEWDTQNNDGTQDSLLTFLRKKFDTVSVAELFGLDNRELQKLWAKTASAKKVLEPEKQPAFDKTA